MDYKALISRCEALEARLIAAEARISDLERRERRASISQHAMDSVLTELKRLANEGERTLNAGKIAKAIGMHQTHAAAAIRMLGAEGRIKVIGKRLPTFEVIE